MPGFIVHSSAQVQCPHAGIATASAPFPRVTVSGQPVVAMTSPWVVAGCALLSTTSPPCVTAQFTTAATRVTVGGQPVVLLDSQAVCATSGAPLLILQTQTRVVAT